MIGDRLVRVYATMFFVGYFPFAPGTLASALTAMAVFFLPDLTVQASMIFLLVTTLVGIWASQRCEHIYAAKDPSWIVIDEFVGMLVALIALPKIWWVYLLAFLLFRFFDILKPFPIGQIDRHVSGGLGIILDDLVAGLIARAILSVVLLCL